MSSESLTKAGRAPAAPPLPSPAGSPVVRKRQIEQTLRIYANRYVSLVIEEGVSGIHI